MLDRCWRRRISTSVGNNNDGNDNSNLDNYITDIGIGDDDTGKK